MSLSDFSPHPAASTGRGFNGKSTNDSVGGEFSPTSRLSGSVGDASSAAVGGGHGGGSIELPTLALGTSMLTPTTTSYDRHGEDNILFRAKDGNLRSKPRRFHFLSPPDLVGGGSNDNTAPTTNTLNKSWQHLYVLPVLLLEFLAIALTRAVLPAMLLQKYGNRVYLVLGFADCVRGILAFVACPIFGKVSDVVGRRLCLLVTVIGSCAPVCSLALFSWNDNDVHITTSGWDQPDYYNDTAKYFDRSIRQQQASLNGSSSGTAEPEDDSATAAIWSILSSEGQDNNMYNGIPPNAITLFVVLLMLSGIFSSTFTLVFAYISDTVRHRDERVSAYGLALATFGLSFTIGPMAGGYLAQSNRHDVFLCSLLLTIADVLYIYFILPESTSVSSNASTAASIVSLEHHVTWSPLETLRIIAVDPFLRRVGQVAFLYYTGLWALLSTLSLYAVKRFHLSPERLGELMSALGLCTMLAEAVLVRIMVPLLGEKRSTRLGLLSFALQCVFLGVAYEGWHLFVCAALSLLGNLVYPSLSSLVSGSVEPEAVGEALGAVNGIKALTEGIGPLVFGTLMTLSENSSLPGWPYLLAAVLVLGAYKVAAELPDDHDDKADDGYVHELEFKPSRMKRNNLFSSSPSPTNCGESLINQYLETLPATPHRSAVEEEEYQPLLSEVDESDEDDIQVAPRPSKKHPS